MAVVGIEGAPPLDDAGNVLRAETAVKLSFRLPPTADADTAAAALRALLTDGPARRAPWSRSSGDESATGWAAAPTAPWLADALATSVGGHLRRPGPLHRASAGAIPFINMLGERFPDAQFVVTGVLGPGSNAHGPNEFLHVPTARRLVRLHGPRPRRPRPPPA